MAQNYQTVVGNQQPDLVFTVQRNNTAINVTGATVELIITNERTGLQTNAGRTSCTLTTPVTGIVTYASNSADFTTEDRYIGEVKITYSTTKVERVSELLVVVARAATT